MIIRRLPAEASGTREWERLSRLCDKSGRCERRLNKALHRSWHFDPSIRVARSLHSHPQPLAAVSTCRSNDEGCAPHLPVAVRPSSVSRPLYFFNPRPRARFRQLKRCETRDYVRSFDIRDRGSRNDEKQRIVMSVRSRVARRV